MNQNQFNQTLQLSELLQKVINQEIDENEFENKIIKSMEQTHNEMIVSDLLILSQSQTQFTSSINQN